MKLPIRSLKALSIGNITTLLPIIDRILSHQNTASKLESEHRLEISKIESHHNISLSDIDAKLQISLAELNNIDRENMRYHHDQGKLIDMLEKLTDSNDQNTLQKIQIVGSVFLQSAFGKKLKYNLIEK